MILAYWLEHSGLVPSFLEKVADTCCIADSGQSIELLRPYGPHALP